MMWFWKVAFTMFTVDFLMVSSALLLLGACLRLHSLEALDLDWDPRPASPQSIYLLCCQVGTFLLPAMSLSPFCQHLGAFDLNVSVRGWGQL